MLKAKAKAAATAAAQRRKAAAAAAIAQQEAAAQQAQAQAAGVGMSMTRSGRGIRPNLTQYWADSAASILAPGGSIQRIGYDQAAFEEAFRVVVLGEEPTPVAEGQEAPSRVGIIEKKKPESDQETVEGGAAPATNGESGFKLDKEDLNYITSNLDVPRDVAARVLRAHKGDVVATLGELTAPVPEALA
ncbi:huntingtin-interacting protein K [Sporobolomyces koalae]|uniref:huntingtin-interacting protein K n=1 Tax=Sporobolomyces koalae TaxID=500713 RepID=UPI00317C46B9